MESLSDKSLAQMMNNRPLVYTKRVNNIETTSTERTQTNLEKELYQKISNQFTDSKINKLRESINEKLKQKTPKPLTLEEGLVYYMDEVSKKGFKFEDNVKRMNLSDPTSLSELIGKATESQSQFKEVSVNLQEELRKRLNIKNVELTSREGLKGIYRIVQKSVNDYNGDLSRIFDVNGGTLTFNIFSEAENAFNEAKDILGDKVALSKAVQTSYGYKDFKINIEMDNGFIGEMILLDKDTMWAKE